MILKKIISTIISFVIILSMFLPIIVLAKDEIDSESKINSFEENTIEENEEKEESKENIQQSEDKDINIQDEIKNENNIDKEQDVIKNETTQKKSRIVENIQTQEENSNLSVSYRTHVQDIGWQEYVKDGKMSGTSGKGLRLEGINIKLLNNNENLKVKYQVHIQDIGWQGWKYNDEMAGTSGRALRLEGIKIELEKTEEYSIMYRVHVQDIGWQEWKYDGEMAGTSGKSLRLEAIEIKIVEKRKKGIVQIETPKENTTYYNKEESNIEVVGWKMANVSNTYIKAYIDNKEIESTAITYYERTDVINEITGYGTAIQNPKPGYRFNIDISELSSGKHRIKVELYSKNSVITTQIISISIDNEVHVKYQSHIQNIGWQEEKKDAEMSGTTGQSKRMEAIKIQLFNQSNNMHIKYRAYVQGVGWQEYVQDGAIAGTTDQSKRIEAIQMELVGLDDYVVEYRVYLQNKGWQVWASNGMIAGTINQYLRIEAIQIRIVRKENTVVPGVIYNSHVQNIGWTNDVKNGTTSGTIGKYIEALKINLCNTNGHVSYQVHVENIGWKDYVRDGNIGGTTGQSLSIEAIRIKLQGLEGYSVEYRTYIKGEGWQDWTRDDRISGTTGKNLPIEAIQIRINTDYYNDKNQSDFEMINTTKYPGYREALAKLQSAHQNWTIKLYYTGLKWDDVLNAEEGYSYGEPYSLTQSGGEWRNYADSNSYQGDWYKASRKAIAYMMDPRNSLDQYYIFQFQNLANSSNETIDSISNITMGTYLKNYSSIIISASENYNVSAFHLASRMIQEQGNSGWSVNGYLYNNNGTMIKVYNFANIGATGTTMDEIISKGSKYAFEHKWFTPEACIYGTAQYIYNNYLAHGQNTKYFEKYNVVVKPYYSNQYMQNIRAANDEGYAAAKALEKSSLLDTPFEFLIPVYEDMPVTSCPRPNN